MPLVKQRGFKFSILCDVFLLIFLIFISIFINVISCVPTNTTTTTTVIPIVTIPTEVTTTTTKTTSAAELTETKELSSKLNLNNKTNFNEIATTIKNNNNKTDKNNNNNNNKELPIQYAELETLKTLSKRFDIYSDFSKIPFDTIHRILRDEEPEYRNDDKRIQRRWKKSTTSTEYSVHHTIKKRSPIITTTTTTTNTQKNENIDDQYIEFSFLNNYDNKNINLNDNNNNLNYLNNNYNNNNNINTSSDYSTKIINLGNKNNSIETIMILLNQYIQNINNNNNNNNSSSLSLTSSLIDIEHLNLTNNNLSDISILLLFIQNNSNLVNLKYLDLSKNKIKIFQLPITIKIKVLNLSNNQIKNFKILPLSISTILFNSNLNILNLSNNNINSLKLINLTMLNNLKYLDLSCNHISIIDKNYFYDNIKTLKYLNLSGNKLKNIYNEQFYNLININILILSYNNITNIDLDTFLILPNLQYLDLSNNNIKGNSIRSLQGIPDLVGLSISYNPQLCDSLQEFVASWSLKELDISGTGLCEIPAALAQSVRSLKLVNNWFEIIRCGDLDSYPLLQYLDLSYSHINDIEDDALGRLEILETLFLDHNNLNRVPISLPISLEYLFLHNNQIMDIQPQTFQTLINLKILDLSENKIMYLPGLPLPKLLTLNLQACELRGLSQSVVKTSPKLRDLLLDGNPIKCSDLLGIAEWASPCQSVRISEPKDIKTIFQNMHNYFQYFKGNNDNKGILSCEEEIEDNCCGNYKMKELKKPICANSINNNKIKKRLSNQINRTNDNDNDKDSKETQHNSEKILNLVGKNISEKNLKRQQIMEQFNKLQKNIEINEGNEKGKLYDNQNGSLFMNNVSSVRDIFKSSSLSTSIKNAAIPNEHKTNIKILEKLFNDTSTNEQLYKDINNKNNSNIKSTLFDAKIPILSLSYNSNESFIGDVSHETTNFVKEKKSENIEQQKQQQKQEKQGTKGKIISNIKSDNNYVETSVLFESIRSQERKQNESQFELKNEKDEKEENKKAKTVKVNEDNIDIKKLQIPKIIEGKRLSKYIEMLPKMKENNSSSSFSTITNENFQERTKNLQNYSDTNLRTIDEGHIDMSVAIKMSQINTSTSLPIATTQEKHSNIEISKESLLTLSHNDNNDPEIFINDQSMPDHNDDDDDDEANIEQLKSTAHIMASPFKSHTNEKILTNNKKIQTLQNITKDERKVNFPEIKSNLQKNNSKNYRRKNMKDIINAKLFSSTPFSFNLQATTTSTTKMKISTIKNEIKTTTATTIPASEIATASQITKIIPSKLNKADKVVFFDQPLAIKGDNIVNRNQNIPHSLGRDYHQIEKTTTVKQEILSTNFHHQSQKKQQQKQQQDKRLFRNKKEHQQESKLQSSKGDTQQKQLNFQTTLNNTVRMENSFQKDRRYNLSMTSQQEKFNVRKTTKTTTIPSPTTQINIINPTAINNIHGILTDKQNNTFFVNVNDKKIKKDNENFITSNKSLTHGTINTDNSTSNQLFSFLNNFKMSQIILNMTKINSTNNLKRNRGKQQQQQQQRKYITKSHKVQSINLENSPLMKNENDNTFNSEENFMTKAQLKNLKINENTGKNTEYEIKITTPDKYLSETTHNHLNTPKNTIIENNNSEFMNLSPLKNSKNNDFYDTEKLTTHSLIHHTVNTAILPYTIDDYAFERTGNKEIHENPLQEKDLISIKYPKKLESQSNLDILSSYANDEPIHQDLFDSKFNTNDKEITDEGNSNTDKDHISFNNKDIRNSHKNVIFKIEENILKSKISDIESPAVNQTLETNENFNLTSINNIHNNRINDSKNDSSTTITHIYNSTLNSNSSMMASSRGNNSNNGSGNALENGLPPEQWLDIRKATGHPGLFIVIGVTFGMLLTLGLIHIYRCQRPWYYYYSQKGPHPLHHHQNSHSHHHHHDHHLNNHQQNQNNQNRLQHHHHHHHHGHQHPHDNVHRYFNNNSRRHSLTTSSDNYCHCDEEDYYIEADYESQSSSIRQDFLPMELLNLNGNDQNDESISNTSINNPSNNKDNNNSNNNDNLHRTRRNINGHNIDIW